MQHQGPFPPARRASCHSYTARKKIQPGENAATEKTGDFALRSLHILHPEPRLGNGFGFGIEYPGSSHDDNNDDSGHVDAAELSGRLMVVF